MCRFLPNARYYLTDEFWHNMLQSKLDPYWFGPTTGAFPQEVTKEVVRAAIERRELPDGTRAKQGKGPKGFELITMAHKSVVLAQAVASEKIHSSRFFQAQKDANEKALSFLMAEGLYAKASAKGNDYTFVHGNVLVFTHAHDSLGGYNPHTHNVFVRPAQDGTGKIRNLSPVSITDNMQLFHAAYQKTIDEHCQKWGFRTVLQNGHTAVKDIPEELVKEASVRKSQIDAYLQKHGIQSTPASRAIGAGKTKPKPQKFNHPERLMLMQKWLQERGVSYEQVVHQRQDVSDMISLWKAAHIVNDTLKALGQSQVFIDKKSALTQAILNSIGTHATLEHIKQDIDQRFSRAKEFGLHQVAEKGFVRVEEIERAKGLLKAIEPEKPKQIEAPQQTVEAQQAPQLPEPSRTTTYARIDITVKTPTVQMQNDSLEKFLHDTKRPKYRTWHGAAIKAAFMEGSGNLLQRLERAEVAFKQQAKAYKRIERNSLLRVSNGEHAPIPDLIRLATLAKKSRSHAEIHVAEHAFERVKTALEQVPSIQHHYTLTK